MRQPRSQLAIAAVALLLGLLIVIQLRAQQAGTGLATQSSQDLTLLVANLNTRNDPPRDPRSVPRTIARTDPRIDP